MNNHNCWRVRDPDAVGNHVIYAACGGQCNGDKNDGHCFGGSLFNQEHVCALCRQADKFVLMHVCEELRPEQLSVDVLCGDCIVKALLTTETHKTAFVPQRHATPVVTCLLGMTLLQEIQNIITTIDADSHVADKWTWSFEFEKRIYMVPRSAPRRARAVRGGAQGAGAGAGGIGGVAGRGGGGGRGRGRGGRGGGALMPLNAQGRGRGGRRGGAVMPPNARARASPQRNDVDLLIKVKRQNLCVFYIIGAAQKLTLCALAYSTTTYTHVLSPILTHVHPHTHIHTHTPVFSRTTVENEMSETISLKKQIEDRWIYHLCKDNVPAADQDDDAVRNQAYAPPRRRPAPPSARNNNHRHNNRDGDDGDIDGNNSGNSGSGDDGGGHDGGGNGSDGGSDSNDSGGGSDGGNSVGLDIGAESDDSSRAQPALDNKLPIRVCIGYQFQKYQTPPMSRRRGNMTVAARRALRDQQLLKTGIRNHQVASVLSAATRKTCLLDYARICDYLLQSTTNDSHVYTYRLFSLERTVRIDSFDWPQTQRGIHAAAGVNRVMIGNNEIRVVHRDIATPLSPDVGRQWILRQTACTDDAKAVWTRQNGLCAYCDVMTAPPDGEGVATCCSEYASRIVHLSDTAKLRKMKQDANTELGRLVYDRVLYGERSVFLCMPCVQVHTINRLDKVLGFSHSPEMPVPVNIGHNDDVLFDYLAACSGLHLVFSMFLCEVALSQHAQRPGATVAAATATVAGGTAGTAPLVPSTQLTIMAYVTNLREAELVYLKVDKAQLAPYLRQRLRTGFTRNHPNLANAALNVLVETSPDTTNAATTIS